MSTVDIALQYGAKSNTEKKIATKENLLHWGVVSDAMFEPFAMQSECCLFSLTNLINTNTENFIRLFSVH